MTQRYTCRWVVVFWFAAVAVLSSFARAERGVGVTAKALYQPTQTTRKPQLHSSAVLNVDSDQQQHPASWVSRGGAVASNTLRNAIAGSIVMALIEKIVKKTFQTYDIAFPAQLGACIFLFVFLLLTELVNADAANWIFTALSPGSALLAKWLPVFFVPGLAMLPLAPPIGDASEVVKVLLVVVIGWFYTLTTTSFAVLTLRQAQGSISSAKTPVKSATTTSSSPAKPFSDSTMSFVLEGTIMFTILSVVATRSKSSLATPLQTACLGLSTVAAYVWGARLPASFTKVVHPLVTSCALLLVMVRVMAGLTGSDFLSVLKTFKVGSLDPMKAGAGDILLYLLGPSVVSFAVSMFSRRHLMKSNLLVVIVAMMISSAGGLFGTAAFVRAIALGGVGATMVRLSVLSRNVTTALAIAVTEMLGGDISIAASVVVLTGILGATYGKTFLTAIGITDPVTRGLAVGASSQGLGVASIADEPDAFPFAAMSMVLTAICATTLVSIPAVKESLIKLATGN